MSDKPYFAFLEDGKSPPPYQNGEGEFSLALCKAGLNEARQAAIEGLEAFKCAADRAAKRIAGCQKGFFVGKAEKDAVYDVLCHFFLEIEALKQGLSESAVQLTHIAEGLADQIRRTGEVDTERTRCEKRAVRICDSLIVFCTKTAEQFCAAIDQVADTEHECNGVRMGETERLCTGFSEVLTALQSSIKEDRF